LRIVVEVSALSHGRTGIPTYIRGSLRGLAEAADGRHELVAFAVANARGGREAIRAALEGLPFELHLTPVPFAHRVRTVWSRLGRPALERVLGRFDVLHFWEWMYPPQRSGVRSTTIHDLVPLRFPDWVTPRTRSMHVAKYRHAARTCDLVFTNSEFTAAEVEAELRVERERLRVAYPGVDARYGPEGERADLGRPYLLAVGTDPRKNVETLLEAHRLLAGDRLLAVAGEGGPAPAARDRVRVLGYVSDRELARLYRGADAFVFPSRFEGFGIPVVEAMASGVPCVVSAHPSLDEACGRAAIRAEPDSPAELAAAIEQALARRDALVPLGLEHARRFTWQATGRALLAGYEAAA
jgi:glycosyltransferase involved in cell wall biosynthesis